MASHSVYRLSGGAAAALFLVVAALWLLAVKRSSENDAKPGPDHHHQEPDLPFSGEDKVPAVFLSHSGKQKPFVENLCEALRRANRSAFFDVDTLRKGVKFPPHIKRAALGCKLGVVVLSEDFFISRWPMLELEMLVLERGSDTNVFPLFYKLRPEDLKCSKNLCRWRRAWRKNGGQRAQKWEEAVRKLRAFNGEIFTQDPSEAAYIEKVVHNICKHVPSQTKYDLSTIRGHERLTQEVARRFEHLANARECDKTKACFVGLNGEGGSGKTTLCKCLVNFYDSSSEYPGRCHLLEFPTADRDEKLRLKNIVEECVKALRKLTNLSYDHVLKEADDFDKVLNLMMENLKWYDVFLAIDNVWEGSREEAARILAVSFSARSKILVTSRSEQVLNDMLRAQINSSVGPLPALKDEEALQIFQDNFQVADSENTLVNKTQLDRLLMSCCMFSNTYHALALKGLGQHAKKVCTFWSSENSEAQLSLIQREITSAGLPNLEKVIRLSYEDLQPEHKKHMFLDIVVVLLSEEFFNGLTCAKAHQWLSFLYKQIPMTRIASLISELASDGLIQFEIVHINGRVEKAIRVHDLYRDLAQREAANSSRFYTDRSNKSVEEIEWEKLERVILTGVKNQCVIDKLLQQECRKLQVLDACDIELCSGLQLDLMPSLCVLKLERVIVRSIQNWSAAAGLAVVILRNCAVQNLKCVQPLEPIPSMPSLEDLIICSNWKPGTAGQLMTGPPNLHGCQHLKELELDYSSFFGKGEAYLEGDYESNYVNCLPNLEILYLERNTARVLNVNALVSLQKFSVIKWKFLERIEGLDVLKKLEQLHVSGCPCLRDLDGLRGLLQLEDLRVGECASIKEIPDLNGLTRLERLELRWNKSMEELRGLSATPKEIVVHNCQSLKKMPDLSGLTRLERLELGRNKSMEELGGLSATPKEIVVKYCQSLKKMPDLSGLTRLERLELTGNRSMEEVGGLSATLKEIDVRDSRSLKKTPDLSGLTSLETLQLFDNKSMKYMGGFSSTLKNVHVSRCKALKGLADISGLTRLKELKLEGDASLMKVEGEYVSSTLEILCISKCIRLKSFPSLNGCVHLRVLEGDPHLAGVISFDKMVLANLRQLTLRRGTWFTPEQWKCLALLTHLHIFNWSGSVKRDVGCLSTLTLLKGLQVWFCEEVEEIGGLSLLRSLDELHIGWCRRLKRLRGLRAVLTHLHALTLHSCKALEASNIPDMGLLTTIEKVSIYRCGKLPDYSRAS